MSDAVDPVDALLDRHGVHGPWEPLPLTGIANRIYATCDVVLRVATDHPEAISDARTESVAAPVARAAGIRVPELLAWDDSREIVDRPYSLWERIHGETLGLYAKEPDRVSDTWRDVGRELAALHTRVTECRDPDGWLDEPGRRTDLSTPLATIAAALEPTVVTWLQEWIDALRPAVLVPTARCFLHDDLHDMNVMCARDCRLRALIDWGDAGWGDPVLEVARVPLPALAYVMEGYSAVAPELLGEVPAARMLWDRIDNLLWDLADDPADRASLDALARFLETDGATWARELR